MQKIFTIFLFYLFLLGQKVSFAQTWSQYLNTANYFVRLDYDNAGNVYVLDNAASLNYWEYDKNGNLINGWTAWPTTFPNWSGTFGSFAVERSSGQVYITEPYNLGRILRVGIDTSCCCYGCEWWLAKTTSYGLLIAGGGTNTSGIVQVATINYDMSGLSSQNILGVTEPYHDVCALAVDNINSNVYIMTAKSTGATVGIMNNRLIKFSLPLPSAIQWNVSSGYSFTEVGFQQGINASNGFNGLAVCNDTLYSTDGKILKQWNTLDGSLINFVNTGGTKDINSGIAAGYGKIFTGVNKSVAVYNSSLSKIDAIAQADTVYDVQIGNGNIYACGRNGMVSSTAYSFTDCVDNTYLPITLLYFKGYAQDEVNILEWKTAEEINNDYFLIKKGADLKAMMPMAKVTANPPNYNLIDGNPFNTTTYYSLFQVDYDGKVDSLQTIAVENIKKKILMNIST